MSIELHYSRTVRVLAGVVAFFYLVAFCIYAFHCRELKDISAFWKISMVAIATYLAIQTATFSMEAFAPDSAVYATYSKTVLYYGAVL